MGHDGAMRKANPNVLIDEFIKRANSSLADWRAIDNAITTIGPGQLPLRRRAATDSFLALAISWESFMSSWFVAAVNREPRTTLTELTKKLKSHATEKLNIPDEILAPSLLITKHLNLETVSTILDASGHNVVVADHADLQAKAKKWLHHPYRTKARAITELEFSAALVARRIRNMFAHESSSGSAEAWKIVQSTSIHPSFRVTSRKSKLNINGWRGYIFESVDKIPRIEIFHSELIMLANRLRS